MPSPQPPDTSAPGADVESESPTSNTQADGPHILIVDDSAIQAKAAAKLFLSMGYRNVTVCLDPFQVPQLVREKSVSIVFCDWNMPECSGIEIFQALRSDPRSKEIPFVVVTANSDREHVIQAVRHGITHYVVKPATAQILREKLETFDLA